MVFFANDLSVLWESIWFYLNIEFYYMKYKYLEQ